MELKHKMVRTFGKEAELLIVPYGIETGKHKPSMSIRILLIVPYGIETPYLHVLHRMVPILLIVPYGIETGYLYSQDVSQLKLLIVPYGIETCFYAIHWHPYPPFNRTLWN